MISWDHHHRTDAARGVLYKTGKYVQTPKLFGRDCSGFSHLVYNLCHEYVGLAEFGCVSLLSEPRLESAKSFVPLRNSSSSSSYFFCSCSCATNFSSPPPPAFRDTEKFGWRNFFSLLLFLPTFFFSVYRVLRLLRLLLLPQ